MLQESLTHQIWALTNLLALRTYWTERLVRKMDGQSLFFMNFKLLQFGYLDNAHDEGLYQLKKIQQKEHQPPMRSQKNEILNDERRRIDAVGFVLARHGQKWFQLSVNHPLLPKGWTGLEAVTQARQRRSNPLSHLLACVTFMHKHRFSTGHIYIYWLQLMKHSKKLIIY